MLTPGRGPMPIYRLLERESFDPEVVALLCEVFEDVLATLGLVDRLDPVKELTLEAFQGRKA